MNPKVSVIVPIYKVESFIERCARSLFNQTLDEVEFIFVDDCSPDNSISILNRVIEENNNLRDCCHIVKHSVNRGLPSARNTGLSIAKGEYVFHCDSDDWVEHDMLEQMYSAAIMNDADIVWSDFFISFEKDERYMRARYYDSAEELLRKGFLGGAMKYNVWNKIVRRSLYEGISFPDDHSMGEDMTMIMLAAKANKVAYVPKGLYHYVKLNNNAYTNTFSPRHLEDIRYNTNRVLSFLLNNYPGKYNTEIEFFKLNVKLPFLISNKREDYHRWKEWFPESNAFALMNKQLPLRTRLLQWAASNNLWCLVRCYYWAFQFRYGIQYK